MLPRWGKAIFAAWIPRALPWAIGVCAVGTLESFPIALATAGLVVFFEDLSLPMLPRWGKAIFAAWIPRALPWAIGVCAVGTLESFPIALVTTFLVVFFEDLSLAMLPLWGKTIFAAWIPRALPWAIGVCAVGPLDLFLIALATTSPLCRFSTDSIDGTTQWTLVLDFQNSNPARTTR